MNIKQKYKQLPTKQKEKLKMAGALALATGTCLTWPLSAVAIIYTVGAKWLIDAAKINRRESRKRYAKCFEHPKHSQSKYFDKD